VYTCCTSLTYRYLAEKYKLDMSSAANVNNLNNAIKRGSEKGDLNLPKGLGGRVKGPAKVSLPYNIR
jgi:histone H1/5